MPTFDVRMGRVWGETDLVVYVYVYTCFVHDIITQYASHRCKYRGLTYTDFDYADQLGCACLRKYCALNHLEPVDTRLLHAGCASNVYVASAPTPRVKTTRASMIVAMIFTFRSWDDSGSRGFRST